MTKSTPGVSKCFVFKSTPEAFMSPLFFKIILPWEPQSQTPPFRSDAPSHYLACT